MIEAGQPVCCGRLPENFNNSLDKSWFVKTITVGADVRESRYQLWSRITIVTLVKDVMLSSYRLVNPDKLVGRWSCQLPATPQRPSGHDYS